MGLPPSGYCMSGHSCSAAKIVPLKRTWHRRTLMLSAWLVEVLEAHARLLAEMRQLAGQKWRENDLLFPSDVGTPAGG